MGLTDHEKRIVDALGQTMFPRDRVIDVDGRDAGVVDYIEDYLWRMPPFSRTQVRALLRTFDLGYGAFVRRPGARFVAAPPSDRAAYLDSWESSTTYTQRLLYEGLRAMMTFAYTDSDPVQHVLSQEVPR